MKIGASYYPEFCPPEEWDADLARMRDAGIAAVRVLDFAWSVMEPREGEYDWGWLDRFVDLADRREMDLVFCTPTATPPAWLATQYPQIMIEMRRGDRRPFGARRDVDVCSPIYREYACEIADRMGERYGRHPRLVGWQIDNELCGSEHEFPESHTPETTWRFRRWLRDRYGTVDRVNDAWYLTFWNQRWSDWGEVTTPRPDRVTHGWAIDYARFFSDMQVEFARLQYDVLRPLIDGRQWITHNSTAMFDRGLDHADMARALDVAGWDAYYGAASAGHGYRGEFVALACDWLRTATRKPIKIMETSFEKFTPEGLDQYLGLLARHGADLVMLYHWRAKRGNVEQGGGVCGFDGRPRPERLARVHQAVATARETAPAEPTKRSCAFIFSVDNYRVNLHRPSWVHKPARPDYLDAMIPTYAAALEHLGPMDVVAPGEPLTDYRIVFAPALRLLDEEDAAVIRDYVAVGGVLVAAGQMAHQSTTGVFHRTLGQPLQPMLGVEVRFEPSEPDGVEIVWPGGDVHPAEGWFERWDACDGEVLASFQGGAHDGVPAMLHRRYGKGAVFFSAATGLDAVRRLLPIALEAAGLAEKVTPPANSTAR